MTTTAPLKNDKLRVLLIMIQMRPLLPHPLPPLQQPQTQANAIRIQPKIQPHPMTTPMNFNQ